MSKADPDSPPASLAEKVQEDIESVHAVLDDPDAEFGDPEARHKLERRLLWKLDTRMFILTIIYILNYIDRTNTAAARLQGFEADLHLEGHQFATVLSILYVGYISMQIPSNILLNFMGKPSLHLPICMALWGVLSIMTGIAKDFVGALFTRFFLGFMEAAFFPGSLFLLSKWYKRSELGVRTAILYCGNIISSAFGALIASGILDTMQGKLGRAAWRWLFYIEGSLTIFVAICAIFILPDFPATTRGKWFSEQERRLALHRMEEDAGVGDERQTEIDQRGSGLLMAVTDWKVWWMGVAMLCQVLALSYITYFPTLCATMGFNTTVTLLLCAPPFVLTAIVAYYNSRHSDRTGERFYHISVPWAIGIVGFIISMCTMNTAARYISLFLMALQSAGLIVLYTWVSNSFPRPPSKRAAAVALTNAISQLGNVTGAYIWPSNWGPTYRYSYAICTAAGGLTIIMCYIFKLHLMSLNKKMDKEEAEKGVKQRGFRYLV